MSDVHTYSSDVAFTPAVKAIQTRKGSREAYAHVEARGGWRTEIDENLAGFLAETNSFYLATATADGQPYIQHRGGPKGFVKILDKNTHRVRRLQRQPAVHHAGQSVGESEGAYLRDGLCASPPRQDLGRGARGRGRSGADGIADAAGLQGAARAGDPVQDFGVGHQLPAAYSAKIRRGRCRAGAGRARRPHRRARGRTGRIEGPARPANRRQAAAACCTGAQANSG